MEPRRTFDNRRIKAYKEHIYHLHHSAQRMQSLSTTTGRQEQTASIILHYKINAVLENFHLLWSVFQLLSTWGVGYQNWGHCSVWVRTPNLFTCHWLMHLVISINIYGEYNTTFWLPEQDSLGNVIEDRASKAIFSLKKATPPLSFHLPWKISMSDYI